MGSETTLLNYLWGGMLLAGMLWGAINGTWNEVTQALLDSAKESVSLGITMLGILSFWCGIMEIGSRAGLVRWLTGCMAPVLDFLFPELERDHPAREPIAVNIIANMLGLGMAATPAGLKAMQEMEADIRDEARTVTASMCTFLILNISSLQLIPVTLIAYRSQYGSKQPEAVLGPALAATTVSTLTAVAFCKIMDLRNRNRSRCRKRMMESRNPEKGVPGAGNVREVTRP